MTALSHYAATTFAALRAKVDYPVSLFNHIKMMLDDDDRVAKVCQPIEDLQQLLHIIKMEPGGWFVKDIERPPCLPAAELAGELDPLRLAAGKRRGGLA